MSLETPQNMEKLLKKKWLCRICEECAKKHKSEIKSTSHAKEIPKKNMRKSAIQSDVSQLKCLQCKID